MRPDEDGSATDGARDELETCMVGGKQFVRIELEDRILLVSPRCPHKGTPISEGYVVGEFLVCRRHGATFDLRTGKWVRGPKCGNITVKTLEATDAGAAGA